MLKNIRKIVASKSDSDKSGAEKKPGNKDETPSYSINDSTDKHRAQAVSTHNTLDDVLELAKSDSSELVREAASRRCAQLMEDNDTSKGTLTSLLTNQRALFFSIAAQSNHDSLRHLALEKSETDADLLLSLIHI